MKRRVIIAAVCLVGLLSTGLYLLEYEVRQMERRLAMLDEGLRQDRQAIRVLRAEWTYLNRPERLQALATEYRDALALSPISPKQVAGLADLPERPVRLALAADGGMNDVWPVPMVKPMHLRLGLAVRANGSAR